MFIFLEKPTLVYTRITSNLQLNLIDAHMEQVSLCEAYCRARSLSMVGIIFEGNEHEITDAAVERIIHEAGTKHVTTLVCSDITRISKRTERVNEVIERLKERGITVQFIKK